MTVPYIICFVKMLSAAYVPIYVYSIPVVSQMYEFKGITPLQNQ